MSRAPTVSLSYLGALLDDLRQHGHDPQQVLAGLTPIPADRDTRIAEADAADWFARAAEVLGDDALGLHVGAQIRPGHYGVLGYAAMACATLGEALHCQQRYQALVLSIAAPEVHLDGEQLTLSWRTDGGIRYRQLAEFNFSALMNYLRWLTGQRLTPLRVDFMHPAPADLRAHQQLFGAPLRFAQPAYRVVIPRAWLALPLVQPDPAMQALMDRLASQQLAHLQPSEDYIAQARRKLADSLSRTAMDLPALAAALALSPRTLQRKLQDAGLSFTQLLDEVRSEVAQQLLRDEQLSLTDIAFLLGYSEQSAFTRAYRRWTGEAPVVARQRARSSEP